MAQPLGKNHTKTYTEYPNRLFLLKAQKQVTKIRIQRDFGD